MDLIILDNHSDISIVSKTRMECYCWIGLLYSDYDTFTIFHR